MTAARKFLADLSKRVATRLKYLSLLKNCSTTPSRHSAFRLDRNLAILASIGGG